MLKQPKMGCHLIFYWVCDPPSDDLHGWKGMYWCRVVPTSMWAKITYKNLIQSRLYKCNPYMHYNFIYVKKILLPYKNTIGKTR